MASWDISPAGVRGVLARTSSVAADFEAELAKTSSALQSGARESSGLVAGAVAGFAASVRPDLEFVVARTGSALRGAAKATAAYVAGDVEMAGNAQAAAAGAPDPAPPGAGGAGPRGGR